MHEPEHVIGMDTGQETAAQNRIGCRYNRGGGLGQLGRSGANHKCLKTRFLRQELILLQTCKVAGYSDRIEPAGGVAYGKSSANHVESWTAAERVICGQQRALLWAGSWVSPQQSSKPGCVSMSSFPLQLA
jgi:hypothetical protein